MLQPVHDLRQRLELCLIRVRYCRREVVHHERLAEGIRFVIVVHLPARGDPRLQGFERVPWMRL